MEKRGLFITFEGIDGCGKTTQAWKLAEHIWHMDKHNHLVITRNPYKDTNIRAIIKSDENPYSQAEKLAKLFTDDRKIQTSEIIIPNIKKGIHVISDRYAFSTMAYQQAQGVALKKLMELHKGLPIPDLIFVVDVPIKVAIKRLRKDSKRKSIEHKFEVNEEFIAKLKKNYCELAKLPKHNVIVIDGRKKPEEIFEKQIKPAFDKLYNSQFHS